jgi:hypothetical protein
LASLIIGLEALVLTPILSWYEFSALIISRFVAETSLELIDAFRHIEQSGSLSTYIDTFEEIMGKMKVQNCDRTTSGRSSSTRISLSNSQRGENTINTHEYNTIY